jgi:hypothetical protein
MAETSKKQQWLNVYESFQELSAREKCAVLESAYIPIPERLLAEIENEKYFDPIKAGDYK